MNTLPSLSSWITTQLQAWSLASNVRITETDAFSEDQFSIKLRAQLTEPYQLQVRFYFNRGHLDYAYQLFTDVPLLRWDNKEDAGDVATAPHHFHNEEGNIRESPLNGDPAHDWPLVRVALEQFLSDWTQSGHSHLVRKIL
ncbi:MAG TPA: DUF6516 family protein [Anaerolineales bacterium]|nr:DUF6516 family protein [Anaerolineales bacterium]